MGTHTGRAYLNSCIKVPIDPCNNCPAPVYNRPKLCMGKQNKAKPTTAKSLDAVETLKWTEAKTGIRSLAKFYDSIPDYCEVKHLHNAEFYSTLESLRTTSRELRATEQPKERCASASVTSSSSCKTKARYAKSKKLKNKLPLPLPLPLPLSPTPTPLLMTPSIPALSLPDRVLTVTDNTHSSGCLNDEYDQCLRDLSRLKSFKQDFAIEVADFKRTLKNFELEFKRNAERPNTTSSSSGTQTHPNAPIAKVPGMHTAERAKCRRESLRRSFSVNDLNSKGMPIPLSTENSTKACPPLSKYFPTKDTSVAACSVVPHLHIESPSVSSKRSNSSVTSGSSRVRRRRSRKAKMASTQPTHKTPTLLSILELEQVPKRTTSVSPQHPVARPNLAATLRAEVSRKKVKELQNNCTYHDPRPQFDWEVRKTPAWKSLSLNEPHKALLSIRLATRKAEQALQERQYDLHMQMMQQRVKSAPLLLEGATYWGPEVGKLSHTCRSEGMRHTCESNQQRRSRQHKKKCTSGRCTTAPTDSDAKVQQLRKIYGAQLKPSSRQSHRSCSRRRLTEQTPELHDSGDDLCSVDRAFL